MLGTKTMCFILFQGAFWMLVSGRVQFVLQVLKFGSVFPLDCYRHCLKKLRWMEMNIRTISKRVRIHFQRSSKVVSCKIHVRPCILFVPIRLNSHYFHRVYGHQPNSRGLYIRTYYIRIPTKGGVPILSPI